MQIMGQYRAEKKFDNNFHLRDSTDEQTDGHRTTAKTALTR